MEAKVDTTYNGWANYETWNVSLYINNYEGLYFTAREFVSSKTDKSGVYLAFVRELELYRKDWETVRYGTKVGETPDGVFWLDPSLDFDELDEMMWEIAHG